MKVVGESGVSTIADSSSRTGHTPGLHGSSLISAEWLSLQVIQTELQTVDSSTINHLKKTDVTGHHLGSIQSVTTSSGVAVTKSVMSEIIGPEFRGESGENGLAAA